MPFIQAPTLKKCWHVLWPLLFYASLSIIFFVNQPDFRHYYYGLTTDPMAFIWFLNWWPYALSHGLNPFITKSIWFPAGFNLTWAASIPFLALIAYPITVLAGPVCAYNILTLAAPAMAAWTACLLFKELTHHTPAALVGGYIFGFSSYELNTMLSAPNLDTITLVPLAVLLCLLYLKSKLSWPALIVWLALVLLAQIGISTEILATMCITGGISWAILLFFSPPSGRPKLWRLAGGACLAGLAAATLAAPFFYYLIIGLSTVPKLIHPIDSGAVDLANYLFPVLPVASVHAAFTQIMDEFRGYAPDKNAFLGLPLMILMGAYFWGRRRQPYVKALAAITAVLIVLSLGAKLHFNGQTTAIWMPWTVMTRVPVIRSILPGRLIMYVSLCAGMMAALWLAEGKPNRLRHMAAGLACLVLVPDRAQIVPAPWHVTDWFVPQRHFMWSPWPNDAFFTPDHVLRALGNNKNVLLLPIPAFGPGMAWQVNAGMTFTQSGGYAGLTPLPEMAWPILNVMVFGPPEPHFESDLIDFCKVHHVNYILMGPNVAPSIVTAIHQLNWPSRMDDGIEVITVEPGAR